MFLTTRTAGALTLVLLSAQLSTFATQNHDLNGSSSVHPDVVRLLNESSAPVKVWLFFRDKGEHTTAERELAFEKVEQAYPVRAVLRRSLRRNVSGHPHLFDERDLPISPFYLEQVKAAGAEVVIETTWLNGVSAIVTRSDLTRLEQLACIEEIRLVGRGVRLASTAPTIPIASSAPGTGGFYGESEAQLLQIDIPALHSAGKTGSGVVIGVLDSGFRLDHDVFNFPGHPIQVIAQHDFVNGDSVVGEEPGDPAGQHDHGTMVLSTIAGYLPNTFVGAAYDASFILCKTEDISSETQVEEDYYVAGLQFIELNGGDIATSSLGYIDWYTQADLDGMSAVTTRAVNIATQNGVHCCTAAGNSGNDTDPTTSHLIAPADAFDVITCGAVDSTGALAAFSSDGSTADGRAKPEVLAWGVSTVAASPSDTTSLVTVSGTSLSTPLIAGAVACLTGSKPNWSVSALRKQAFATATSIGAPQPDPLFAEGFGLLQANLADTHLDLGSMNPGLAGVTNTFDVTGATPGSFVYMVYGFASGSVTLPGCPMGVQAGLASPILYGATIADIGGQAGFSVPVPAAAIGLTVYIQLAELSSCRVSELEIVTF
jgi:serine protease AprX